MLHDVSYTNEGGPDYDAAAHEQKNQLGGLFYRWGSTNPDITPKKCYSWYTRGSHMSVPNSSEYDECLKWDPPEIEDFLPLPLREVFREVLSSPFRT